jgi:large subunit ribosomal protein L4
MSEKVSCNVVDISGKKVGSVELAKDVFAQRAYKELVQQTVRWQRAKKRAGTHQALTRTLMDGGNKKPWKQKHTGNARAGSTVSPLWVGGASVHGPLPRSYEFGLQKKVRRKALASALSDKLKKENLLVINSLNVESGKTKDMVEVLSKLGLSDKKVVIVLNDNLETADQNLARASRNIPGVQAIKVAGVNVYDVVNADAVIASEKAITALEKRLGEKN